MALKEQLSRLALEHNSPCVSISLNTHRTHPDNLKDEIVLKNFLKQAWERVVEEFGKRPVASLLEKIENVDSEIDINYNLDSLHIFLSNDTKEIINSSWPSSNEGVHISESFAVRSIIKDYNRSVNYLAALLSQSGVQLYEVQNDTIIGEIVNDDFPFSENLHYNTFPDKGSDSKHIDNLLLEFLNKVDKALVRVFNETDLPCVVICTEDNYTKLLEVADRPAMYIGHAAIDYNNTAKHQVAAQAWQVVKLLQHQERAKAIEDMKEAVAKANVLTDLQEIFRAAIDGRGETLIVHQDFSQPVKMIDERNFEIVADGTLPDTIDDITSTIAWQVISKKGNVYFTSQDEIKELGKIVLKTRY